MSNWRDLFNALSEDDRIEAIGLTEILAGATLSVFAEADEMDDEEVAKDLENQAGVDIVFNEVQLPPNVSHLMQGARVFQITSTAPALAVRFPQGLMWAALPGRAERILPLVFKARRSYVDDVLAAADAEAAEEEEEGAEAEGAATSTPEPS